MSQTDLREHVVKTADRLYYARGIQSVGMDDLRAEAGVPLKRLYSMFPSKNAIVLEVLQRRHRIWTDGVSARVATVTSPRDKLLAVYDYLADWFADDSFRGCGFINAFAEMGAVTPEVAQLAREHKESFQRFVSDLVAQAGAPADLAPQLAILAEGAQTTAAISGTTEAAGQARRAAEVLIDAAAR
ncbi:TetR/AcrR family transcriptional regulator [Glaciibacter superstes]|uniref:TetR/AcrR family transcriptional regulator n=1 Tax=Glaciibacter superstes TaxID=501023 RepID=UPI0003B4CB4F|nr:TetR/AcrR family transcriptional regulator [Glaciibacter superstes]